MRSQIVTILSLLLSFLSTTSMLAQGSGPDLPEPGRRPPPPELPLDQNILILIIAGVLLGIYFIYKRKGITNTSR